MMIETAEERRLRGLRALSSKIWASMDRIVDEMTAHLAERIPDLPQDPAMVASLGRSVASNIDIAAQIYAGTVLPDAFELPPDALEYARQLAHRGVSTTALVRAYRLGQHLHLTWCIDEVEGANPQPEEALAAIRQLLAISFRYTDYISESVLREYLTERDRWLAYHSTVRIKMLERIMQTPEVDIAAAESALRHRLGQHHLGALLWSDFGTETVAGQRVLEQAVDALAALADIDGSPLVWVQDPAAVRVWLPLGGRSRSPVVGDAADELRRIAPRVRLALGVPGFGLSGFRQTMGDALQAADVAVAGAGERVVSYGDPSVRAAAFMATDLDRTRRLVASALGDLATRTESAARLRETLQAFLQEQGSHVATGQRLHIHKNTVKYRVGKAIECRGRPLDEDRLDLELALIACRWLGGAVLRDPDG